ncbi:hypothetical protein C8Q80DRAFT_1222149 [Daedaleopsis nitida]|nr:hypothetical protein C8Q80DRAFT_1222149 [Daedaleopsis nitida]
MDALTKWRPEHEDSGYIMQKNSGLTKAVIAALRMRRARTYFRWVKGHTGHWRNEGADRYAGRGARKTQRDAVDTRIPASLSVTGCKLSVITQRTAKSARINTRKVLDGVKQSFGVCLDESNVWTSIRRKEISRECRQFLWMCIHNGYMVGHKWQRETMSAELQERAICKVCDEVESMEHILFDCRCTERGVIWELMEETWSHTEEQWSEPSWGSVIGAGCARFKSSDGRRKAPLEALWSILASESAYLLWKLRCERVIQNEGREFSRREVTNRWYSTIDLRYDLDRRSCSTYLGKSALKSATVGRVWEPIMMDPENASMSLSTRSRGVLVGIRRGR